MNPPSSSRTPSAGVAQPSGQTAVTLVRASEQVLAAWSKGEDFTEQTLARASEGVQRFTKRLTAQGVDTLEQVRPEHCAGFIDATTVKGSPPLLTSRHTRRTTLRMYFRTLRQLGHDVGDPTLDILLPVRTATTARPLTDDEVTLARVTARLGDAGTRSLQRAVCWALAEATAVTSEISAIRVRDVDDARAPRWVQLPGTRRHDPRAGELTDWGSLIVARQLQALTQSRHTSATLLTYKGRGTPGEAGAQASICNAIGAVLDSAGLAREPDVRPASVRNWAGRRLYDSGLPLEQVALRLGARTLDSAAADIGLDWRAQRRGGGA